MCFLFRFSGVFNHRKLSIVSHASKFRVAAPPRGQHEKTLEILPKVEKKTNLSKQDSSGACTKANNNNKPSSGLENDFWHKTQTEKQTLSQTERRKGRRTS